MTIRVNGGVFNDQVLTGDLRHFRVKGADFSGAVSDGSVILSDVSYGLNGQNNQIPHYVPEKVAVPGSAAEIVYVLLSTKATIVIMNPDTIGLHFAIENSSNGWIDALDIQTVIRALGSNVGIDAVDLSNVEVFETTYSLSSPLPPDSYGWLFNDGNGAVSWDDKVWSSSDIIPVVTVNDFPPAVNGVRELTSGSNVTYILLGNTYDFGSDVFTVTGGQCTIRGFSRFSHKLITASAGNFFTSVGASLAMEYLNIRCPNATAFHVTGGAGASFIMNTVTIENTSRLADIYASTTVFRRVTLFKSSLGGIRFFNNITQLVIESFFALSTQISPSYGYAGTLIDFGSATFSFINIVQSRFLSSASNTILSGLPNNANLSVSGRAVITDNIFDGAGTYIGGGLDIDDVRFTYDANSGIRSSMTDALNTLTNNATATDIITVNVPVKVAGTWVSEHAERFTVDSTGRATYNGLDPIELSIFVSASMAPTAGNNVNLGLYVYLTGSPITYSLVRSAATAGLPQVYATFAKLRITTGSYFEIWVVNTTNNTDILVSEAKYLIG